MKYLLLYVGKIQYSKFYVQYNILERLIIKNGITYIPKVINGTVKSTTSSLSAVMVKSVIAKSALCKS